MTIRFGPFSLDLDTRQLRREAREVHLMAEAGLVKATQSDKSDPPEAMITKITHAGHQFYHALHNVRSFRTADRFGLPSRLVTP